MAHVSYVQPEMTSQAATFARTTGLITPDDQRLLSLYRWGCSRCTPLESTGKNPVFIRPDEMTAAVIGLC